MWKSTPRPNGGTTVKGKTMFTHTTNEDLVNDSTAIKCNTTGKKEKWIDIDHSSFKFQFTKRWFFYRNMTTWSTFLPDRFSADQPWNVIQIGVFEGMDVTWCMQNLFSHPDSRVLAIDPWMGMNEKWTQEKMEKVHERAIGNLRQWNNKIQMVRGFSQNILKSLINQGSTTIKGKKVAVGEFDLVIIDGDHRWDFVLPDAEHALKLAKPGGWLLFDDVRNARKKRGMAHKGVRKFVDAHDSEVQLIWQHRHCDCFEKLPIPEPVIEEGVIDGDA